MWNRLKAILADFFQQADLVLLGLCCAATVFGMVLIASATHYMDAAKMLRYVGVQGVAMLLGFCVYVFMSMVDIEIVLKKWKWLVLFNLVFIGLLKTPFGVGGASTGNQAWLKFPGIPFQIGPAEVVKITFTLLLAKQLAWLREEKRDLRSFPAAAQVAGHTLALMGWYVVISGDMGNALTFFFIFLCMAFAAGFALRWFALLFAGCGIGFAAAWVLELIPGYMMDRFRVLFDHSYDALDTGWQQTRSLMAIGSGGLFGQGYMNGTQTQSSFPQSLPNRWTDFIFSVCGEELGLVGCLAVITLLAVIIFRVLRVARNAQTPFHCYICVGMAAMLIYQTVVNIGMCLFVMPTIGVTLPFFSYGGSSVLTLFAAMGVVSGIKKRSPALWRPRRQR
ncbi:FtsW/RodA/SpoVE family cell cycle protein [Dysosmobacter sp.]|jgi:rod shape determining protein RodA|uniref:FtsW/RodA/SpoVE family cell cycle protein n=1 Tax=Dysosmobacter sp. TaxID=2591382 RepID=UPI001BB472C2|nr:FtsW/RodA/SpoVE family cell cycle protein [Dysosmobacter sp.]MCI6055339.1 FtsW/RodA/SpoVE family cell cycle protein [Dysosmobacter sp.]MDY5511196.1 FtsW/RodA/SpoVE family cell cycle protein [Dysosmobacter sp.]QUO38247.1 FtsW/RodA/SpoVE family cell cycle protein [Dysosmobacter sp. Marseille-Q4140]